jgi:hypothetical protein
MSANANASQLKPWRPRLADVDSIIGACCRSWPPTVDDYASRIGVPPDELTRWIGKITRALKARPDALNCLRHLADLRKTGRRWPSVLPSDIQRRENALQRAKALAARMPDGWPNPPPPPPNHNIRLDAWEGRRISHGPHERRERAVFDEFGDDGDDGD